LTQLVVLAYADEHRAAEVLATLQRLRTGSLIDIGDTVSVVRATDWRVTIHYRADLSTDEKQASQFWRKLIASLLLAPGGATTGARPDDACGLDVAFVRNVGAALAPGSSAVLLLVVRAALSRVLPELVRFGGTLLQTPIDHTAVNRLRRRPTTSKAGVELSKPAPVGPSHDLHAAG
jgi:uncharacterized membrane protein